MAVACGEKVKVFIQSPDGRVMEVNSVAISINMERDISLISRTRIELEAIGPITWMSNDLFNTAIRMRRSAKEYRCSWCGSPNKIHRTHCSQCGGARDFILGE